MSTDTYVDWREQAACAADPDGQFPAVRDAEAVEAARRVCRRCSISVECLQFALDEDIEHGVWGGMTAAERRTLKETGVVRPPLPRGACPVCGKESTLWSGQIRKHNYHDEEMVWTRCPGSGSKP